MPAHSSLPTPALHITNASTAEAVPVTEETARIVGISLFSNDLSGLLSLASAAAGNIPIVSAIDRLLDHLGNSIGFSGNFRKIYR